MVAQLGIEPMTTRCLVVALTTKLLGQRWNILMLASGLRSSVASCNL